MSKKDMNYQRALEEKGGGWSPGGFCIHRRNEREGGNLRYLDEEGR